MLIQKELRDGTHHTALALSGNLETGKHRENAGVIHPQELLGPDRNAVMQVIEGIGGVSRPMDIQPVPVKDLETMVFHAIPGVPIVVVRPRSADTRIVGARHIASEEDTHTIEIYPDRDRPIQKTVLTVSDRGLVTRVVEQGDRPVIPGIATLEQIGKKTMLVLGVPIPPPAPETPDDMQYGAMVILLDRSQMLEPGFGGVAAINVCI